MQSEQSSGPVTSYESNDIPPAALAKVRESATCAMWGHSAPINAWLQVDECVEPDLCLGGSLGSMLRDFAAPSGMNFNNRWNAISGTLHEHT